MKKRAAVLSTLLAVSMAATGCGNLAATEPTQESATVAANIKTDKTSDKTDPNSIDYVIELDPQYNVPTDELLKTFPIEY